ncbi:MAG: S-methyl-5'-thioinosine phosphorylase [Gammaproteobacteria bacterium]|nr:S-methyl-5'-thioinosine phosphorylase [Gammaproteobacteria bacterium]
MYGLIGGSGVDRLPGFEPQRRLPAETRYGPASAPLVIGLLRGHQVAFIPRHGVDHQLPPHRVNYRANTRLLQQAGVTGVVALAAVGAINPAYISGSLAVPDQLIDYTWGRQQTFYDGEVETLEHVDFTEPFDFELRQSLLEAASGCSVPVSDGGCVGVTQGPRLETAAEINRLGRDGADLVSMTLLPEAALAREAGLPYVALAIVVNQAAGRGITEIHAEMAQTLASGAALALRVVEAALAQS